MSDKKDKLTIYDISEKSGVSIATVSRVLNGYSNVNEKTRDKVLAVMNEMGYKPNAFARGLGLDTMKTIGILCADSSDAYLAKAVYYIEEALRAAQYNALLICTGYSFEDKKNALELLLERKVDAAILVGSNFVSSKASENAYIKDAAASIPVMLLNACFECDNVYSLYCNDYAAVKAAVEFLYTKGRKKILYLYNSKSYSGTKKLNGFRDALKEHGTDSLANYAVYVQGGPDDTDNFVNILNNLCENGLDFDAVMASEDYLAIAALKYAIKKGMSIPEDLAVIGYNNSSLSTIFEPELTSVDNKLKPLSEQLVNTLLGVLKGAEMPGKTEYSAELIERRTT